MCSLSLILAIVMTVIAYKVKKLVWQFDKIIPCMLFMMCCSLYSIFLYFGMTDIIQQLYFVDQLCQTPEPKALALPTCYIRQLPAFFLGVGAILNLNKWIYFELRIRAYIKIGCGLHESAIPPPKRQDRSDPSETSESETDSVSDNNSHLFGS